MQSKYTSLIDIASSYQQSLSAARQLQITIRSGSGWIDEYQIYKNYIFFAKKFQIFI